LAEVILDAHGENLVPIIRFFIEHGFDVGKMDGKFGAECLSNVCFSSFDKHFVDAGRELIRAGAVDVVMNGENALDAAMTEGSYQECCEHNYILGSYFETYIKMLEALHEGDTESYYGTLHEAEGKTISHVYAAKPSDDSTFIDMKNHSNTYTATLYFEYDDGFMAVDRYTSIWTAGRLPSGNTEDVSKKFKDILGRRVKKINFVDVPGRRTPELRIDMDSGRRICYGTTFEETDKEAEYRAFFRIEF